MGKWSARRDGGWVDDGGSAGETGDGGGDTGRVCPAWHITVGEEQEVESESEQWSAINERWKRAVSAFKPEDDSRQDTPD